MNENEILSEASIDINLPVKIGYPVLDEYLKEKLVGEIISKDDGTGSSNYAQILDISAYRSELSDFDLSIELSLQTLTTFFKNKQIKILFHALLDLDREEQRIFLKDYEVDGLSNGWFADQLIETIINKWMYKKLKEKMNFEFMPHIQEHLESLNERLENKLEAREGIHLLGGVDRLEVTRLIFAEHNVWIALKIEGNGLLELTQLKF
ncbi:DUF4403 family protein [Gramella sp. KN1008]|uniref:DUF4403 family protein n=1 Tax=Gramella sp. KN1008 TaxID=2529298 RepID=UPI00103CFBAC|nr:DUF4403 family protein [Gramella sp. KN1008]TBW27986.1 DUF4403 family protein [Gramella sp. KN1008]